MICVEADEWDGVVSAFVDGWATEYAAANQYAGINMSFHIDVVALTKR